MSKELTIQHGLGDLVVKTFEKINSVKMKKTLLSALENYLDGEERIPASIFRREVRREAGDFYDTPGYNLRIYRIRRDFTQEMLAKLMNLSRKRISEMENNKRPIDKATEEKLAKILKFDRGDLEKRRIKDEEDIKTGEKLSIHHDLANLVVEPFEKIDSARLKQTLHSALDNYRDEERVYSDREELIPASVLLREPGKEIGDYADTPGFSLRFYRKRLDLTQAELAKETNIRQTHLSEMENNKRPIGKTLAKKLAKTLNFDYRKLL